MNEWCNVVVTGALQVSSTISSAVSLPGNRAAVEDETFFVAEIHSHCNKTFGNEASDEPRTIRNILVATRQYLYRTPF
jgi:hypothetical protein